MAKFHISNGVVRQCRATVQACRFGGDADHYEDRAAAEIALAEKAAAKKVGGRGRRSTTVDGVPVRRNLAKEAYASTADVLRDRAKRAIQLGESEQEVEENKNRAQACAVYARDQGNFHLLEKMADAEPVSRRFSAGTDADGKPIIYTTDQIVDSKTVENHVARERAKIEKAAAEFVVREGIDPKTKASVHLDDGTSVTATIRTGVTNKDAFKSLPESIQKEMGGWTDGYSIEKADQYFSPEVVERISSVTQVADVFIQNPATERLGLDKVSGQTSFYGTTDAEKMTSVARSMAGLYSDTLTHAQTTVKSAKVSRTAGTDAMKATLESEGIPKAISSARRTGNGVLVTKRRNLVRPEKMLEAGLSQDDIAMLRTPVFAPDKARAEAALAAGRITKAQFDSVFNATSVSFRVTESKN